MHTIGSRELGKNYRQGIAGMRRDLLDVFVDNMPKRKAEQKGYLLALYLIRNNFLPHAYCRSDEMWNIEEQVNVAIARLTAPKSESNTS